MIHFVCPACAKTLKVPDHSSGKKGPCPHCGQRLQVPATARNKTVLGQTPPQEADWHNARLGCQEPPPAAEYPSYEEPMRTPNGTKLGCVALSIVLVALVCMGVAVYFLSQDTSGQAIQKETPHLAAATAAGTMLVVFILLSCIYSLFWIFCMVWVARDAKNRSIDGGAMWVIIVFFAHFLGLIVYMAARPHGMLSTCHSCQNRKLNYARLCPHCGQA